jgi:hypothetical protein
LGVVPRYAVLTADQEREVLNDIKIEAPPGLQVETISVRLTRARNTATFRQSHALRAETRITYDEYLIEGRWSVTATPECPAGDHEVRIGFRGLPRMCKSLKVAQPGDDRAITIRVRLGQRQ